MIPGATSPGSPAAWQIVHDRPGRLRLRLETLRRDCARGARIVETLRGLPGVSRVQFGRWTGSLLVLYNPALLSARLVIEWAEQALSGWSGFSVSAPPPPSSMGVARRRSPVSFALPNTALGLAVVGELVVPPLLWASALLMIGTNGHTFAAAWRQLRDRQLGLPVLYTTLVGGTLASRQFVSSALMLWFMSHWKKRYFDELAAFHERLRREGPPALDSERWLAAATAPAPGAFAMTSQAEVVAERAVGPTLALAGVGLVVGGLPPAQAILRPDYASGPGLAIMMERLRDVLACARVGVFVLDPSVFERLAGVDWIVLDDHPVLRRPEATAAWSRFRCRWNVPVALISERPQAAITVMGAALGVNVARGGLTPESQARFLHACRRQGLKAAFLGDPERSARVAAEAEVIIALVERDRPGPERAAVWLPEDRLDRLEKLWEIARAQGDRIRADVAWTIAPNVLCAAGALVLGWSSLVSVLVSNLGTYATYRRAAMSVLSPAGARPMSFFASEC
jgi:hypothetical protein